VFFIKIIIVCYAESTNQRFPLQYPVSKQPTHKWCEDWSLDQLLFLYLLSTSTVTSRNTLKFVITRSCRESSGTLVWHNGRAEQLMKVWQEHEHIFSVKSCSNWGWSHWDVIGEKIPVLMHSRHGVVSLAYFFCRMCTLALYVVGFLVFFLRVCFRLCKYKFLFMQTENTPTLINHVIPKLCKSKLHKSEQHLFKYLFDIRICWKWNT
jgi:hypothetical protein